MLKLEKTWSEPYYSKSIESDPIDSTPLIQMNGLNKINFLFGKILEVIGNFFANFFSYFFESFGWRGFLFRVFFAILLFKLSTAGMPEYNMGTSGGKLLLISGGLLIYAVGKLIYDYTKAGRESEAKKRKNIESS